MNVQGSRFVDYHCHLDLYPDYHKAFTECSRLAIATLAVTTTPKAYPKNRELALTTEHVRAALGLHPQLVAERATEINLFEKYLPDARYVGEVGLDAGPQFYSSFRQQVAVFERILRLCAEVGSKIISVHSTRSVRQVLDLIERHLLNSHCHVVFHWFTGTRADAKRAVELGCLFSINSAMLESTSRSAVVSTLPLDRLLTETDGPFVQVQGRSIQPADVERTVKQLARVRNTTSAEMAAALVANLQTLES